MFVPYLAPTSTSSRQSKKLQNAACEEIMQQFGQLFASLRTEFRHAWFPTLLICSMVILHDLATDSRHGGLVVVLLIAAFMLARPTRLRRHSPLEN